MKHYTQEGGSIKLTPLQESGNVCDCCKDFLHSGEGEHSSLPDDVPCPDCGALCCCNCHREKQ